MKKEVTWYKADGDLNYYKKIRSDSNEYVPKEYKPKRKKSVKSDG